MFTCEVCAAAEHMLTWSVHKVFMWLVCDTISDGLAEEEADVMDSGSLNGKALFAVPDNVPLVWTQTLVGELWEEGGNNTHQIFDCTTTLRKVALYI